MKVAHDKGVEPVGGEGKGRKDLVRREIAKGIGKADFGYTTERFINPIAAEQ